MQKALETAGRVNQTLASTERAAKQLREDTRHALQAVAKIRQRAATNEAMEQQIWAIHAEVREHRNSLNSDEVCRRIRQAIEVAVTNVQHRCETLAADNAVLQQQLDDALADLRAAKRKNRPKK